MAIVKYVIAAAAGIGTVAMVACSLIVPAGDLQCVTNADCQARGPQFASATCVENVCQAPAVAVSDAGAEASDPWACLTEPSVPGTQPQVDVNILLYDVLRPSHFGSTIDGGNDLTVTGYTGQAGVLVKACGSLDLGCTSAENTAVSDSNGIAIIRPSGSFIGFYSMTRSDSIPALFYPGAHLLESDVNPVFSTAMTSNDSIASLGAAYGVVPNQNTDAGPGLLSVTQFDCNDRHVAGVSFTTTPGAEKVLYLKGAFPSATATETAVEGSAIMVNVASGSTEVVSTIAATKRQLQDVNVNIQPGALTLLYLRPRAR